MTKIIRIFIAFVFVILISNCDNNQNKEKEKPKNVNYTIENQDFFKDLKATFDVRLEDKISKEVIKAIANDIKRNNPGYDKYFIAYLLPGMEINNGAWATSHFNPSLEVNILGSETDNITKIDKSLSDIKEEKIIGKWEDNTLGKLFIIHKDSSNYKLRTIYKDGSFGDKKLTKKGNIYNFDNRRSYIKIEKNGYLGWYDQDGRFLKLKGLNR